MGLSDDGTAASSGNIFTDVGVPRLEAERLLRDCDRESRLAVHATMVARKKAKGPLVRGLKAPRVLIWATGSADSIALEMARSDRMKSKKRRGAYVGSSGDPHRLRVTPVASFRCLEGPQRGPRR